MTKRTLYIYVSLMMLLELSRKCTTSNKYYEKLRIVNILLDQMPNRLIPSKL
jgi:hypothetical protein